MNEIIKLYKDWVDNPRFCARAVKDTLRTIINQVKQERNLPPNVYVTLAIVRQRISRNKIFAVNCGHTSPLLNITPAVISTIKEMCQI